jgi:hypothetical protein
MCDFTDYGIAEDEPRVKKRIIEEEEDWDTEPEIEKVQEENEHIIMTQ